MNILILENDTEYIVVEEKVINNITYYLLALKSDPDKICFRKKIIKDGEDYISMLADDNELKMVINEFNN